MRGEPVPAAWSGRRRFGGGHGHESEQPAGAAGARVDALALAEVTPSADLQRQRRGGGFREHAGGQFRRQRLGQVAAGQGCGPQVQGAAVGQHDHAVVVDADQRRRHMEEGLLGGADQRLVAVDAVGLWSERLSSCAFISCQARGCFAVLLVEQRVFLRHFLLLEGLAQGARATGRRPTAW